MDKAADESLERCLGLLLRHPEPLRDVAVERALLRLQAARSDAAYLLLHRVLVLETALQALSPQGPGTSVANTPGPSLATAAAPAGQAATRASTRGFMRDAAALAAGVAAGVVTGQVVWQAIESDTGAGDAEGPDFGFEL